jgi:hypothetical protein
MEGGFLMLAPVIPKDNRLVSAAYHFWQRCAMHPVSSGGPPSVMAALAPLPLPVERRSLDHLASPGAGLPAFVGEDPVARRYLELLGPLDWEHFPERPANRAWPGKQPAPRAPYVAAYLVKLNEGLRSMGKLRQFLIEHPALVWLLGFPLVPDPAAKHGFDVARSVPTRRQCGRVLRDLDNAAAQFLLDGTVRLIARELPPNVNFGDVISLDTKHILAWVKENNPKAYVSERYDKTRQPKGDPDCRLGCKKRHNRGEGDGSEQPTSESRSPASQPPVPTSTPATATHAPTSHAVPASPVSVGEYYWGYASGVVTTKVPGWGEFVLAELTQTFDKGDATYFFPLMAQTERRLGHKPRFGALDKAYDAFYVYQYFYEVGGFAAVPLVAKGRHDIRTFSPEGLPICAAGLPMPLKFTFTDRTTTLVVHERGKYVCPLRLPTSSPKVCPVNHENWPKGGCTAMMPTCAGARIRYQLDRESAEYKAIYKQRTADERSNAQAVDLGIERPHLRRQSAIVNQNTLIYVLINLRALQRIRAHKEALARQPKLPRA